MNHLERELCTKLYEQYKERLNWYMWKWFSWLNPEDVHDIQQDTWRKLMEHIDMVGTFSPQEQLNWLLTVCHNQTISFLRKQNKFVDADDETMNRFIDAKQAISLEDKVIDKVMLEELIQKLSEEDKKLLYLSEFSYPKKKQNKSNVETCKLYRVKQKLRKMWKESGWKGDDIRSSY